MLEEFREARPLLACVPSRVHLTKNHVDGVWAVAVLLEGFGKYLYVDQLNVRTFSMNQMTAVDCLELSVHKPKTPKPSTPKP